MIRVSNEHIISGLLLIGFDKIDPILYTHVLGQITFKNDNKEYTFSDEPFCGFFQSVIIHDENGYRLKDGYTLDTNVSLIQDEYLPVRRMLNCDSRFLDYLKQLDYRDVIFKKINAYGVKDINSLSDHFCTKEKGIIADMFGIDDNINVFENTLKSMGVEVPNIPLVRVKKNN